MLHWDANDNKSESDEDEMVVVIQAQGAESQESGSVASIPEVESGEVDKKFRKSVDNIIAAFLNGNETNLTFSSKYSSAQRKYIHLQAQKIELKSKSSGKKDKRQITLTKKPVKANKVLTSSRSLQLAPISQQKITDALQQIQVQSSNSYKMPKSQTGSWGMLSRQLNHKCIPPYPKRIPEQLRSDKEDLPIFSFRQELLNAVESNSIVILNAETGSGKSTQFPQYLLEQATATKTPCRIISTQPRRVAAISVAQRVAHERGETVGKAVGYQIRHEGCLNSTTNLIYTTSGVIIRSLIDNSKQFFNRVTHLIIDEIHERDRNTDFILISLKTHLKEMGNMKVILMSATMNIEQLSSYFDNCPVLQIPGRTYDVKKFFLEDILFHTNFRTKAMDSHLKIVRRNKESSIAEINKKKSAKVDSHTQDILDECITGCFEDPAESESYLVQLSYMLFEEHVPVDSRHSETGQTPLMAATICKDVEFLQKLIKEGANPDLRDSYGKSARDYAEPEFECFFQNVFSSPEDLQASKAELLEAYETTKTEGIDHQLLVTIIKQLCKSDPHNHAIMVFFPGYADIIEQRDVIYDTIDQKDYKLFVLHSSMNTADQQSALRPSRQRKIILSTNIGETSITIPELAFVIDTGRVKTKMYDGTTGTSALTLDWISKACSNQRAGRAGRTQNGICYRLFSQSAFEFMSDFTISELMRVPLEEICLYAKTLNEDMSIAEYLQHALDPPSSLSVATAVKKLKILNVFDEDENITDLGRHLVQIPLDVQLGIMLLYSIMLQCVDPILTIVAYHSIKDPYILPSDPADKKKVSEIRKAFCEETFSDHFGILNMVSKYLSFGNVPWRFCNENFISQQTMETLLATRSQIKSQIERKYIIRSNLNSKSISFIKICLAAGLYPNLAFVNHEKEKISSYMHRRLCVHNQSVVRHSKKPFVVSEVNDEWLVFVEKSRYMGPTLINYITPMPSLIVALFCGRNNKETDENLTALQIDDIQLNVSDDIKPLIKGLRNLIQEWFLYFLQKGYAQPNDTLTSGLMPLIKSLIKTELDAFGSDELKSVPKIQRNHKWAEAKAQASRRRR